ncbi:MAG TPA: SDR family oxidoreductase [Longilinea sp.]|nr:SDR family oxidoreductase [Longilinea sp.]
MTRYLITGASGLLGLHLGWMLAGDNEVTGIGTVPVLYRLPFTFKSFDLSAPGSATTLINETRPNVVFHCAAMAIVDSCENQPETARRINAEVPGEIADACRKNNARMVQISTDAVFDGVKGNYSEADTPNPLSIYAQTKLDGERAVQSLNPAALVARVNFFGWSLTGQRSLAENFVTTLSDGKTMNGFTDVYFCTLYVRQLCKILVEMVDKGLEGLYHTVSSQNMSKYEFGVAIAKRFGLNPDLIQPIIVSQSGLKAARSPLLTLKVDKLTAALGHALPGQSDGLEEFYQDWKAGWPVKMRGLLNEA